MSTLRASRLFCAQSMQRHARSFFLSTRFLPRGKREAIEALYAFFRHVDDTADEGAHAAWWRQNQLDHFRRDIDGLRRTGYGSCAPWFPALQAAYNDFALDTSPLFQLIDGCERDIYGVRVATMDDLRMYAASVAGTVGRSVLPILGASDEDSLRRAEGLGIAMQYTNILRDVDADRAMGRNYLPLHAFPASTVSAVMKRVALQAHALYDNARVLSERLPNDGSRAALLMAATLYRRILYRVEDCGFDPHAGRVYVSGAQKFSLVAQCFIAAYTGLATIK